MAERTARFSNWFQIISNVAIIVGLGLVVYELNQSKQFIHAQLSNEQMTRISDRQLTMMGEDPRDALARAALDPSNLDEKDAVTLDALYTDVLNGWSILRFNSETIGADNGWRFVVANEARLYFSSDPGRRWLNVWAEELAERYGMTEFAGLALEATRDRSVNHYRSRYELLLANE
jgi:hypothetical protein